MEWGVAVAVSVGLGVMAGWVYGGFPRFRKGRRAGRHEYGDLRLLLMDSPPGGSISTAHASSASSASPALTRSMIRAVWILPVVVLVGVQLEVASPSQAASGDLDPTFGTGGKVTTDFGSGSAANAGAVQADGKIVTAGGAGGDFALARYDTDGTLDATFGTGGKVTTDFGSSSDQADAVAVQTDGKIVAAGTGAVAGGSMDFALARYNPDGTLDMTFGTLGKVTTDFFLGQAQDQAFAVTLQADGKIVAAGLGWRGSGTRFDFALARYNVNGILDATFGTGGRVTTSFSGGDDFGFAVALQDDGRIVAAGESFATFAGSQADDFALARYNLDGTLDSSFGTGGKVTTDFSGSFDRAAEMAVQEDGKIVAAGAAGSGVEQDFALARYKPDGTLDTTFGTGGEVTTDFSGWYDGASGMALQRDGKIVAAGWAGIPRPRFIGTDFGLVRYNLDGTLDSSFGTGGKVTTSFSGDLERARAVALQPDGRIVAVGRGSIEEASSNDFALARYRVEADLSVTKTGPPGRVPTGRNMTYTLTVANNGPDQAAEVTAIDQLPSSVSFVSAAPSQGSCGESAGTVTCALGSMANGAVATVDIVVTPKSAGTITNTARVSALTPDPNEINNTDSVGTSICRITSRRSSIPCG